MTEKNTDTNSPLKALRSACPVAASLDVLGDKWTLIVIRDLLLGSKTYGDLQKSPEAIPTNILADRLKKLEAGGLVDKTLYQHNPKRYEYLLTEKGKDLGPLLIELVKWGLKHVEGTQSHPLVAAYLD
jgi:DNA-binding HxlR family transcriptional regulator